MRQSTKKCWEGTILSKVAMVAVLLLFVTSLSAQAAVPAGGTITATARDVAKNMYPGWNLGNTLEGGVAANNDTNKGDLGAETVWQPTKTTKEFIDFVKASGFRSVRIPTAWIMGHISDPATSRIDADWLKRVKEIVDYCIDDGLYVVLNDHWDGGWIEVLGFSKNASSYEKVDDATIEAKAAKLKTLWTQIANAFRDYDEHLVFAGMNEPFQEYNLFSKHHEELTPILEKYNQAFVDAVRATGGKNATRVLLVQGPSVNIASTCKYFHMPEDKVSGKLMVEVHNYSPYDLCLAANFYYWGEGNYVDGNAHNATYYKEAEMASEYSLLRSTFVDKGYPVIVGECAALWRDLTGQAGENQDKHDASIKAWYYQLNKVATDNGVVNMAWDTNSTNRAGTTGTSTIFDRSAVKVFNSFALDGIMEGCKAGKWPY